MPARTIFCALLILLLGSAFGEWPSFFSAQPACEPLVGLRKEGEPGRLLCDPAQLALELGSCLPGPPVRQGDEVILSGSSPCQVEVRPLPADRLIALGLPIPLNEASAEDLELLDGIGPKLAQKVVAARPFSELQDLKKVRGIGPRLFERLRPQVTLEPLPLLWPEPGDAAPPTPSDFVQAFLD